ncbi:hypothetical protein GKQ23_05490 [Erwinia sp. E602]|uniref:hypothetical protein n=1 Tax=Erwinia sp. E602 TaxID=2675378 RepID=UPI001BAB5827|nr:hypothetical protein [Erwinia sp. E602]QUG74492.1 hypothetical protein GKQ23_05490 [Erwinia sp. E602]
MGAVKEKTVASFQHQRLGPQARSREQHMANFAEQFGQMQHDIGVIKIDQAVMMTRSEHFATRSELHEVKLDVQVLKTDVHHLKQDVKELKEDVRVLKVDVLELKVDVLALKTDMKQVKTELHEFKGTFDLFRTEVGKAFADAEIRTNDRFDALNSRITWTLLAPAILGIMAWFAKTALLAA